MKIAYAQSFRWVKVKIFRIYQLAPFKSKHEYNNNKCICTYCNSNGKSMLIHESHKSVEWVKLNQQSRECKTSVVYEPISVIKISAKTHLPIASWAMVVWRRADERRWREKKNEKGMHYQCRRHTAAVAPRWQCICLAHEWQRHQALWDTCRIVNQSCKGLLFISFMIFFCFFFRFYSFGKVRMSNLSPIVSFVCVPSLLLYALLSVRFITLLHPVIFVGARSASANCFGMLTEMCSRLCRSAGALRALISPSFALVSLAFWYFFFFFGLSFLESNKLASHSTFDLQIL